MKTLPAFLMTISALLWTCCATGPNMPSVHEPLGSHQWQQCAGNLQQRQSIGMIDDLTLDSRTLICKAMVLANEGKTDEAIDLLIEAGVQEPDDHRPHYLQGRLLAEAGRFEESLASFQRSQKRFPEMEVPTERLGRQMLHQNEPAQVKRFLSMADERQLCPYGCLGLLARLHHKEGESETAAKIYQRMIELNPDEPAAYVGLASMENNAGSYSAEAQQLEKATRSRGFTELSDRGKADVYYSMAFAYYNAANHGRASAAIKSALRLETGQATWYLLAGWIEIKQDQPQAALNNFARAQQIDPGLLAAAIGVGDTHSAMDQLEQAKIAFNKALAIDSINTIVLLKLAHVQARLGEFDQAEELMNKAHKIDADNLPQDLVTPVTDLLKNRPQ